MALAPFVLAVKPSVDTQGTPSQVANAMIASSWLRFRNGLIQKLGGCAPLGTTPFTGNATALKPFDDLALNQYVGIGTSTQLALISGAGGGSPGLGGFNTLTDITPTSGAGGGHLWWLDSWGQNLVAALSTKTIVQWVPPIAGGNIAAALANAPPNVNGLIVAAPQQQIIAWGAYSSATSTQDPLLVAWCDVGNNTIWTAAANNQAGTYRIPTGSVIQAIAWYGLSGLIWTDLDLWAQTYVNYPLIYGFNKIAPNCGLIAPRAAGILGTRVAWMSQNDFFAFQGGQVQPIECTVRDFVFKNLDRTNLLGVHCDTNAYNGEFMWRFPVSGSGGVPTAYAKWSPNENSTWDYGANGPPITAWSDQSLVGPPIGADTSGLVQQFEQGTDYNGTAIASGFTTGWFALAEGQEFVFLERILPDFILSSGATIQISINFADYIPQTESDYPVRMYGPYTVDLTTPYVIVEGRGRVAQLVVSMPAAGVWRYGRPPAMIAPDGSL